LSGTGRVRRARRSAVGVHPAVRLASVSRVVSAAGLFRTAAAAGFLRTAAAAGLLRAAMAAGFLVALQGCSLLGSPPSVSIVGVNLVSVGLTSGTAEVILDVTNQRSGSLDVRGFLYELEVRDQGDVGGQDLGWRRLAEGFHGERVVVEGNTTHRISLPVPFQYRALGAALRSFLADGEVPYRIRGEVSVRRWGSERTVPFRSQGVLRP
jgi:LEA14-like dessication related protein